MKIVYHSPYDLRRHPRLATAGRVLMAAAVVASFAAAWSTAGPGNGYVAPEQWAAAYRTDLVRVSLPRVEVVGRRTVGGQQMAEAGCAKGA